MSAINRLVNALTQKPSASRRRNGGPSNGPRNKRGNRQRTRTVNNPAWGRSMPAAYASHVRPRFNYLSRSSSSVRVAGCDLVYPVPAAIQTNGDYLFTIIPCNPAYWTGTRIAQLAPAYMTYRPLKMTFSYIPQVAVTQPGTVSMGTLWNGAAGDNDIQQTLFTSNGGCLTQCYVPCDTTIRLGANLQQNLFTLSGAMQPSTSPFIFCAALRGASVVPGYFYVSYEFEFKNPVGQSWTYTRSDVVAASSIAAQALPNSSVVLLSQDGIYGPGTILDLEGTDLFYRGTPVTLTSTTPVQIFSNGQTEGVAAQNEALRTRIADLSSLTVDAYRYNGTDYPITWSQDAVEGATIFARRSGTTAWSYYFQSTPPAAPYYAAVGPDSGTITFLLSSGQAFLSKSFGSSGSSSEIPAVDPQ